MGTTGGSSLIIRLTAPDGQVTNLDSEKDLKNSGVIRFGRDADWADVVLDEALYEKGVGRHHCEVEVGPGGFQVDTNGQGALWQKGKRIYDHQNLGKSCALTFVKDDPTTCWQLDYIIQGNQHQTQFVVTKERDMRWYQKRTAAALVGIVILGLVAFFSLQQSGRGMANLSADQLNSIFSVQVKTKDGYSHVGTAWLAEGGVIVTNRHVAQKHVSAKLPFGESFLRLAAKDGETEGRLIPITAIDYHEGEKRFEEFLRQMPVLAIDGNQLALRPYDIAILKVKDLPDGLKPLSLASPEVIPDLKRGDMLTIAGFPVKRKATEWNLYRPDVQIADVMFNSTRGFAQSKSGPEKDAFLAYENKTEGGNSGSPIFNQDGQVVGIHFSGSSKIDQDGKVVRASGNSYAQSLHLLRLILDQAAGKTIDWGAQQAIWSDWISTLRREENVLLKAAADKHKDKPNHCQADFIYDWKDASQLRSNPKMVRFRGLEIPLGGVGDYWVYVESRDKAACLSNEFSHDQTGCMDLSWSLGFEEGGRLARSQLKRSVAFDFTRKDTSDTKLDLTLGGPSGEGQVRISIHYWSDQQCQVGAYK